MPTDTARLELRTPGRAGAIHQFVDGGWWPRTTDLAAELPSLVATESAAGFTTFRINFSLSAWSDAPRRLVVDGHAIRTGGFALGSGDTVTLTDTNGAKQTLLVVPPDTEPAQAERALARAGDDAGEETTGQMLDVRA